MAFIFHMKPNKSVQTKTSSESYQTERSIPVTRTILIKQLNKYCSFCNGADDGAAQTNPPSVTTECHYEKQQHN